MKIDGFIFDLDGTLYLGDAAIPGAPGALADLRTRGKQVRFVTNKPLEPRENYAAKLSKLGIPAKPGEVITSGYVMGYYLARHHPEMKLYVIGEQNLKDELAGFGLTVLPEYLDQDEKNVIDPVGVDAVVVAFDRTLDYRKLNTAYQALVKGAKFFATNPDKTCPMPGGGIPDAGANIAALSHMTGRELDLLAGKPSTVIMGVAMDVLGTSPERTMMIGDRLETDIRMGKEAGMKTASVLSGASTRQQAEASPYRADLILESVADLPGYIE